MIVSEIAPRLLPLLLAAAAAGAPAPGRLARIGDDRYFARHINYESVQLRLENVRSGLAGLGVQGVDSEERVVRV